MKIGWLLGWAVPESWFGPLARAAFPGAIHTFVPAIPDALQQLEERGPFDWVAGYSLGALVLLGDAVRAGRLGRVALLAPIFAFPREAKRGGKISRTQLRHLARQLRSHSECQPAVDIAGERSGVGKVLADFYGHAGLDVSLEEASPLRVATLLWGLERLEQDSVVPPLPAGWRAWCGAGDALLDAAQLHAIDPAITVVAGATHHPGALLRALAAETGVN